MFYYYRILGIAPEAPKGHMFRSRVQDLHQQPKLWKTCCPYHISEPAGLTMEQVTEKEYYETEMKV